MSKSNMISWEDWIHSFSDEKKAILQSRLKEWAIKPIDIVVFLNTIQLNHSCQEVATELGITIAAVRRRLAKVRKKLPFLREFNKNAPTKTPKRISKTHGEQGHTGDDVENSGMKEFNDEDIYKHEKKFEKRDLGDKPWDDEENRLKKKF